MGLPAAIINTAYVAAGVALFATGEAPVLSPSTDFLGNKLAVYCAGLKFSGCLYMALVNFGVGLRGGAATVLVLATAALNYYSAIEPVIGPLGKVFMVICLPIAALAFSGRLKLTGYCWAFYVVIIPSLFLSKGFAGDTVRGIFLAPEIEAVSDKFSMTWSLWAVSGWIHFVFHNIGVHNGLATFFAMNAYVLVDIYALFYTTDWTVLAYSFIALDGLMGGLGLHEYMNKNKPAGAAPRRSGRRKVR